MDWHTRRTRGSVLRGMKNLIYQYWLGKPGLAVQYGSANMKAYAEKIGADYIFKTNPIWAQQYSDIAQYYNAFEPIWNNTYHEKYDNILFVDTDVFGVDGLTENIFEQGVTEIGICDEPHKEISHLTTRGHINTAGDEKWNKVMRQRFGKEMPRNKDGNLKIYNSGVVLYTKEGREKAQKNWIPFKEYISAVRMAGCNRFYTIDQNYLHAMLIIGNHNFTKLDSGWNSYVHYDGDSNTVPRAVIDNRTDKTKFVHVQLRGADDQDANWHYTVVNKPVSEWKLK